MAYILFFFGVIGMTHILVDSTIMEPLRNWFDKNLPEKVSKLIHCYQCSGFWCGIICGWMAVPDITYFQLFVAGCAGSFLSNFAALWMNVLEAQAVVTLYNNKEQNGG